MNRTMLMAIAAASLALAVAGCTDRTVVFAYAQPDGRLTELRKKWICFSLQESWCDEAFDQLQAGDVDWAIRTLEKGTTSYQGCDECHYDLALIYEARNDWPRAWEEANAAVRLGPKHERRFNAERAFIRAHLAWQP